MGHYLPSAEGVRNMWSYTSAAPICLYGVDRDSFILKRQVGFPPNFYRTIDKVTLLVMWSERCQESE